METNQPETSFGCSYCWSQEAKSAYRAFCGLQTKRFLIEESHYIVTLRSCSHCSQQFLSVFTETIDWVDGEDPQYRIVMPITDEESLKLRASGKSISDDILRAIGIGRRSLRHDYPKDGKVSVYWGEGIQIRHHD
jgi:hypothetical protein